MRRREFITLLGGAAAAWPLAARAQQGDRMRRIGVLIAGAENDPLMQTLLTAFEQELKGLGWVSGRNVQIDIRWATANQNRIQSLAKDIVGLSPDVILAHLTPVVAALRKVTATIPIVFVGVSDPIGDGFVTSMAHPGGHVTGFTNVEFSMASKWLEILKEIAPKVTRVAFMFNPETAPGGGLFYLRPFEAAASAFAVEPSQGAVHNETEIERVMINLASETKGALAVMPDAFTTNNRKQITALAQRYRIPAVYPFRYFADDGGLISYGSNTTDIFRRAASYIDRILKGAKPAELPVQAPTKFELIINLKTAKALGLTVPQTLLARADEVIE